MVGEIVHVELPSRDFARSATFYAKLFGWKTDGVQSGGHLLFDVPGGPQSSLIRDALAQAPGPVPFIAVDDVDRCLSEAEKQGGRILVPRMNLPSRGLFGLLADCDGNVVGVLSARGESGAVRAADKSADKATAKPGDKTDNKTDDKADHKTDDKKLADTSAGKGEKARPKEAKAKTSTESVARPKKPPTRKR